MFKAWFLYAIKTNGSWYIGFSCPCKQCKDNYNAESFMWKYPWRLGL